MAGKSEILALLNKVSGGDPAMQAADMPKTTELPAKDEKKYQEWMNKQGFTSENGFNVDDKLNGTDYDYRGFWKETGGKSLKEGEHLPDTYKLPNHPTFSNESKYANDDNKNYQGKWDGDKYVPFNADYKKKRDGEGAGGNEPQKLMKHLTIDASNSSEVGGDGTPEPDRQAGGKTTFKEDLKEMASPFLNKRDNPVRNLFGKLFSNVKRPAGYNDDTVTPVQIFEGGFNTITGKDEPAWKMSGGFSDEEMKARDYINRAGFMPDKEANRMGGADTFLRTGNNNMILNPKNKFGAHIQSLLDKNAKLLSEDDMNHSMYQGSNEETNTPYEWKDLTGVDMAGIDRNEYRKELKVAPVMANIDFNRTGEGEDSKGYYNMYKGSDAWDFALHSDEKILNKDGSGNMDYKKSAVNLLRSLIDPTMDKQTIDYESKVYPEFEGDATLSNEEQTSPGKYRLKHVMPRNLKVSPGIYMAAD